MDGEKILAVPLGSPVFVNTLFREKMDAVDASLALAAISPYIRIGYNIHRVSASAGRMMKTLLLIPPVEMMAPWRDLYRRQRAWFERIWNVPRSAAAGRQERLPRSPSGLVLYAAK